MKVWKAVFGALAALYCLAQVMQFFQVLTTERGVMQASSLAIVIGLILLSGVLSFVLLRAVFENPRTPGAKH